LNAIVNLPPDFEVEVVSILRQALGEFVSPPPARAGVKSVIPNLDWNDPRIIPLARLA